MSLNTEQDRQSTHNITLWHYSVLPPLSFVHVTRSHFWQQSLTVTLLTCTSLWKMSKQHCVSFALLHYMSLSTILLWLFYIVSNHETYLGLHLKCLILFLSDFTQISTFSADLWLSPMSNFTNVRSVWAELIHADGQMFERTDDSHGETNRRFSRLWERG